MFGETNLVNFGPQTTKFYLLIETHPSGYFPGDHISALRGCCALKFLYTLDIDQDFVAHTPAGMEVPPQKKFNCKNLKFGLKFRV